jgi:TM2 domain-containing membrane protein YozV
MIDATFKVTVLHCNEMKKSYVRARNSGNKFIPLICFVRKTLFSLEKCMGYAWNLMNGNIFLHKYYAQLPPQQHQLYIDYRMHSSKPFPKIGGITASTGSICYSILDMTYFHNADNLVFCTFLSPFYLLSQFPRWWFYTPRLPQI